MDNTDYGQCEWCGANLVKNPKTQKIFCSEKCWLKNQKTTLNPPQENVSQREIQEHIGWSVALNNATQIVVSLIRQEKIQSIENAKIVLKEIAEYVYNLKD